MKCLPVSVLLLLFGLALVQCQICHDEVFFKDQPLVGDRGKDVTWSYMVDEGDVIQDICINMTSVQKVVATYIFKNDDVEKVTTEVDSNSTTQWDCLERFVQARVKKVVLLFVVKGYGKIVLSELTIILCDRKNEVTKDIMRNRLLKKIEGLEKDLDDLIEQCEAQEEFVGFAARITQDFTAPAESVVPFNQANVNQPVGVYNTITGSFTCPADGYYYFAVTAYSTNSYNNFQLCRKRLGQTQDTCFVGAFADKAHWDQGSAQYIIQCNDGDTVFCKQVENGRAVASSQNAFVNAFSGFLIAAS